MRCTGKRSSAAATATLGVAGGGKAKSLMALALRTHKGEVQIATVQTARLASDEHLARSSHSRAAHRAWAPESFRLSRHPDHRDGRGLPAGDDAGERAHPAALRRAARRRVRGARGNRRQPGLDDVRSEGTLDVPRT